ERRLWSPWELRLANGGCCVPDRVTCCLLRRTHTAGRISLWLPVEMSFTINSPTRRHQRAAQGVFIHLPGPPTPPPSTVVLLHQEAGGGPLPHRLPCNALTLKGQRPPVACSQTLCLVIDSAVVSRLPGRSGSFLVEETSSGVKERLVCVAGSELSGLVNVRAPPAARGSGGVGGGSTCPCVTSPLCREKTLLRRGADSIGRAEPLEGSANSELCRALASAAVKQQQQQQAGQISPIDISHHAHTACISIHNPREREAAGESSKTPQDDVYMHVRVGGKESWWESGVGSQSLSPFPEALPKRPPTHTLGNKTSTAASLLRLLSFI
ncbi:unnamed protein product, partial [Pleuronectes platessa]